jgi:hypothetical protein
MASSHQSHSQCCQTLPNNFSHCQSQQYVVGCIKSATTLSNNLQPVLERLANDVDTIDTGILDSRADRATAVSPSEELAKQDVLRNTLIGVLGLFLSAGSLIVAVLHSRRNICRQRDPESATIHLDLEDLHEGGTQRRADPSSENVEISTTDVSRVSHESQSSDVNSVGGNASLKVHTIVFETLHSYYDALVRTITLKPEGMLSHSHSGANAEQLPSHNPDQMLNPGIVHPVTLEHSD